MLVQAILKTGSNLLAAEKKDAWKDLPQATQAEVATRLVSTVENSAFLLADTMHEGTVDVNINVNIRKSLTLHHCYSHLIHVSRKLQIYDNTSLPQIICVRVLFQLYEIYLTY